MQYHFSLIFVEKYKMSSIGPHSNIQIQPSKRTHSLYTSYPQVVPRVLPHLCCMGVNPRTLRSSSLRASNPWLEPGDLPLLTEAMDSTDCFGPMDGLKQTVLSRPPFVESACRRSPLQDGPDCQRCALSFRYCVRKPGCLRCRFATLTPASALRSAFALPAAMPGPH